MIITKDISSASPPNLIRLLLSEIRGGDYAHAGDEEAVDMVLSKVNSINSHLKLEKVLDIGCGFGGTLNYFKNKGFRDIYGLDIDEKAIEYAKQKYHNIQFYTLDALQIETIFKESTFSLLVLFNSIYAIRDKYMLLAHMRHIAKPGAILVIFDYSIPDGKKSLSIQDFSGKDIYPIHLNNGLGWDHIRETREGFRSFQLICH